MAPIKSSGEIHPLRTWEELVGWKEPQDPVDEVVSVAKLRSRTPHPSPSHLRTLLCHDMKGGYLDDRFYRGTSNQDAYRFYHWTGVDTFVYFTHALVTIPPPAWVNAAHLHGVRVLGTFITEWDEGAAICRRLLASKESVSTGVAQLVAIARHHGFEGWLVNIENPIDPEQVKALVDFVRRLKEGMKEECEEAEVVWYDSVTIEGKLEWQNELNDKNRSFFEASDGIFLNYTWTGDHLERSRREAGDGKAAARVYVGLDMFGRNFYEGGKFGTWKALKVARSHGLSAAIFGHGWTYETQDDFVGAERKMWTALAPYLTYRGPGQLPVVTSFCQGHGRAFYVKGKVESSEPWHDLSKQQVQPLWSQEGEGAELSLVNSEAYNGGGCLGITMATPGDVRLFVCGLRWRVALVVSVGYKWKSPTAPLSLLLHLHSTSSTTTGNTADHRTVELRCEEETEEVKKDNDQTSKNTIKDNEMDDDQTSKVKEIDGIKKRKEEDRVEAKRRHNTSAPNVSLVVNYEENGWTVKSFSVREGEGWEVHEVGVRLGAPSTVLLGHVKLSNICIKGITS